MNKADIIQENKNIIKIIIEHCGKVAENLQILYLNVGNDHSEYSVKVGSIRSVTETVLCTIALNNLI